MSDTTLKFGKRFERAIWTWRGNRALVHASRRRSLQLGVKAFFVLPKPTDNREQRRLESV